MSKPTLKTASVLAFERNLDISDAYLWQTNSQADTDKNKDSTRTPVVIKEKSVRGTISNRLKILTKLTPPNQMPRLKSQLTKGRFSILG